MKVLDLSGNEITKMPDSLIALRSLNSLYLADNRLEIVPSSILRLPELVSISLFDNPLKKFPESLENIKKLQSLLKNSNDFADENLAKKIGLMIATENY